MKKLRTKVLGITFATVGVVMILYTGINAAQAENNMNGINNTGMEKSGDSIKWSPIVGLGLLLGGIVLISDKQQEDQEN